MEIVNDPDIQKLVSQIGITLLYSLGMGMLLAILTGLTLLFTKRYTAAVRYNVLTSLLCLFTLSVGSVFYFQMTKNASYVFKGDIGAFSQTTIQRYVYTSPAGSSAGFTGRLWSFIDQNIQMITFLWLAIVLIKTFQLGKGLYELRDLRRNGVIGIGSYWEERLEKLAQKIGISQPVSIIQSGFVKVPMVMGHFKPVILVPFGIVTRIPSDQIEMILLHELAHIRRMDFFVNLLQNFVELLFFFNPAVLWISRLIRKERENCCDDIALQYSGNKKIYINALLSFREYQVEAARYAMAFARESSLVERAKRIAFQKNTALRLSEKVFLGVTVLLLFTFTFLAAQISKDKNNVTIVPQGADFQLKSKAGNASSQHFNHLDRSGTDRVQNQAAKEMPRQTEREDLNYQTGIAENLSALDVTLPAIQMRPDTVPLQTFGKPVIFMSLEPVQPLNLTDTLSGKSTYSNYPKKYRGGEFKDSESGRKLFFYKPIKLARKSIGEEILDEIENAGVKYDRSQVQLHITNKELIINGTKQSDEIHRKVIEKLVKKPGDTIDFTYGSHH